MRGATCDLGSLVTPVFSLRYGRKTLCRDLWGRLCYKSVINDQVLPFFTSCLVSVWLVESFLGGVTSSPVPVGDVGFRSCALDGSTQPRWPGSRQLMGDRLSQTLNVQGDSPAFREAFKEKSGCVLYFWRRVGIICGHSSATCGARYKELALREHNNVLFIACCSHCETGSFIMQTVWSPLQLHFVSL